ncbi:hypothetical protein EIN_230920 [Entamoeba invadens IP1]|uniref:Uncharacterized protein n=1 Tax=Entamoeba invadens IP1 TaxID=370355 RepID=A0A0A1U379_ENTIV|nr:hypothetical protein EIN_230920 [Entamoeba invadens IP1]ELP88479.1 hypothetical protein EIN_230920 [Entamoeba invadens IP1]|eukprot:XP_004255250.1 hypothetical protein EIN_230920 [Entamoeba invadens IP1]
MSKVGESIRVIWKNDHFEMKTMTMKSSAYLEYLFRPTGFKEFVGPEDKDKLVYVNAKRLLSACSMVETAESVEIQLHPTNIIFDIKVNSNVQMARMVQLDEEEEPLDREPTFEQHALVKGNNEVFCAAFTSFPKDTEFIKILVNNNQVEFHSHNKTKKNEKKINAHVIVPVERFDVIKIPRPNDFGSVAQVSLHFSDYKHIMNLAKGLSTSPNLRIKTPSEEAYIDFTYFTFIAVRFTMAGLIEDEETSQTATSKSSEASKLRKYTDDDVVSSVSVSVVKSAVHS